MQSSGHRGQSSVRHRKPGPGLETTRRGITSPVRDGPPPPPPVPESDRATARRQPDRCIDRRQEGDMRVLAVPLLAFLSGMR